MNSDALLALAIIAGFLFVWLVVLPYVSVGGRRTVDSRGRQDVADRARHGPM